MILMKQFVILKSLFKKKMKNNPFINLHSMVNKVLK